MANLVEDKLSAVEDVNIDSSVRFNYVLIRISVDGESKHILRGYDWGKKHSDIYNNEKNYLDQYGIESECTGGGRIDHDKNRKMMLVYGTSSEYERGDHSLAVELLRHYFPDYKSIRFTNVGY